MQALIRALIRALIQALEPAWVVRNITQG